MSGFMATEHEFEATSMGRTHPSGVTWLKTSSFTAFRSTTAHCLLSTWR